MHNSGISNQAFFCALATAWKVLFLEIGHCIGNTQLANGTPCQTTISDTKHQCTAECLILVANEMKVDTSQDLGHKTDLGYLDRIISCPSKYEIDDFQSNTFAWRLMHVIKLPMSLLVVSGNQSVGYYG